MCRARSARLGSLSGFTRRDVHANLAEAVQRSFIDGLPVRSCGAIVLLKLTRQARGASGARMLETAAGLEECHKAVRESGFEVRPEGPTQWGPRLGGPDPGPLSGPRSRPTFLGQDATQQQHSI